MLQQDNGGVFGILAPDSFNPALLFFLETIELR